MHTLLLIQRAAAKSLLGMRGRRQQSSGSQPSPPQHAATARCAPRVEALQEPKLMSSTVEPQYRIKKGEGTSFSQVTLTNTFIIAPAHGFSCILHDPAPPSHTVNYAVLLLLWAQSAGPTESFASSLIPKFIGEVGKGVMHQSEAGR